MEKLLDRLEDIGFADTQLFNSIDPTGGVDVLLRLHYLEYVVQISLKTYFFVLSTSDSIPLYSTNLLTTNVEEIIQNIQKNISEKYCRQ